LLYVKQEQKNKEILEPKIVGIFEVTSEPYVDSRRIFKSSKGEVYLIRVKIKPVRLKFIKNKKK